MFAFRCGEETRIIPRILQVSVAACDCWYYSVVLQVREQWMRSENEVRRLTQGGITSQVIDAAITSFILQAPSYSAATGIL